MRLPGKRVTVNRVAQHHFVANAKKLKDALTKLMTQAQITEAQKRSQEYWTRYVVPFQ